MANVKNAPAGVYFTRHGYSQSYPYALVRMSESGKTATLVSVRTAKDPDWKPNFIPGGFCAHCDNQSEQTWLYDGLEMREIKVRKRKNGTWVRSDETFTESPNGPYYFYDYNF